MVFNSLAFGRGSCSLQQLFRVQAVHVESSPALNTLICWKQKKHVGKKNRWTGVWLILGPLQLMLFEILFKGQAIYCWYNTVYIRGIQYHQEGSITSCVPIHRINHMQNKSARVIWSSFPRQVFSIKSMKMKLTVKLFEKVILTGCVECQVLRMFHWEWMWFCCYPSVWNETANVVSKILSDRSMTKVNSLQKAN